MRWYLGLGLFRGAQLLHLALHEEVLGVDDGDHEVPVGLDGVIGLVYVVMCVRLCVYVVVVFIGVCYLCSDVCLFVLFVWPRWSSWRGGPGPASRP